MLPAGHRIGLVRADAGFCVTALFIALEGHVLPYIIVTRLTPLVRKLVIHRIPEADWQPVVTRGIAVADPPSLPCPDRMNEALDVPSVHRPKVACIERTPIRVRH